MFQKLWKITWHLHKQAHPTTLAHKCGEINRMGTSVTFGHLVVFSMKCVA